MTGYASKRAAAQDKVALNKETLVKRLRDTASRGVSVWGDLMLEAADALEQSAQEPVAWMYEVNHAHTCLDLFEPPDDAYDEGTLYPLYTTPPQRPWVGLTEHEFQLIYDMGRTPTGMMEMVESMLKDKNT